MISKISKTRTQLDLIEMEARELHSCIENVKDTLMLTNKRIDKGNQESRIAYNQETEKITKQQLENHTSVTESLLELKDIIKNNSKEVTALSERVNSLELTLEKLNFCIEQNSVIINKVDEMLKYNQTAFERNNISTMGIHSKLDNIYKYSSNNEKHYVTKTKRFENNFDWYTNCNATDNVTSYIQAGYIGNYPDWDMIDERLWSMMPEKGVFLDIGANIGAFTLPLAAFGWTGYAIEASNENADVLEKSIRENKFDVTLIRKAIWNKSGKLRFVQKGPQGFVEDSIHSNEKYEEIDAICLDDYKHLESLSDITKIDFVKMDIEGSEVAALEGMMNFLKSMKYPPIYIEVNIWNLFCMNSSQKQLFDIVHQMGYVPFEIKEGKLIEYDIENFPDDPCTDYLLLKDIPSYLEYKIHGKYTQSKEQKLGIMRKNMENFKNWVLSGGINPNEVIAHIAWYRLIDEYDEREDEVLKGYRWQIKSGVEHLGNAIFDSMIKTDNV